MNVSTIPERAWNFITLEVRGMHRAAYILAVSAVLSSLLAFLRDRLLAHYFGASLSLDIYYASFRIPDLIFVTTASLVSAYVLIPELARRSDSDAKAYIDTVCGWFSIFIAVTSAVAFLLAPTLLSWFFPNFVADGHLNELIVLTRILLVQPILLGLSNIFAGITQSRHRYALYAATPLLYNLGIILGITVLYPQFGMVGLAWGVVFGALMHLSIQIPSAIKDGFFSGNMTVAPLSSLASTVFISVPRSLALSMGQLTYLGLIGLDGVLAHGSISIFTFAYNLQAAPLAVIGASYSVAAFPKLAQMFSRGERDEFLAQVSTATRHILFWSLPAIALLVVLRAHIVRFVLGSGAFDWTATRLTAAAFALFIVSLAAQAVTLLLIRGYYASGRTFVPFFLSLLSTLLTICIGYTLVSTLGSSAALDFVESIMRVSGVPGSLVLALPLAYTLAAMIGALLLALHFEYMFRGFFTSIMRTLRDSIIAAIVGGAVAYFLLELLGGISPATTALMVFVQGFSAGFFGLCAAAFSYYALGNSEFFEAVQATRRVTGVQEPVLSAEDVAT